MSAGRLCSATKQQNKTSALLVASPESWQFGLRRTKSSGRTSIATRGIYSSNARAHSTDGNCIGKRSRVFESSRAHWEDGSPQIC